MFLTKPKSLILLAAFVVSLLTLGSVPVFAQAPGALAHDDPASFVGLTLSEVIDRFGVPRSVHAARGAMEWQDDVVFVYDHANFYIYGDRVWQVGIRSIRGINVGDLRGLVELVMGTNAVAQGNSIFYPLHIAPWPMLLRWDIDSAGRVQSIFIYRSDL